MVTYQAVVKGISNFIDNEILKKLSGTSKMLMGVGMGVALKRSENIFNVLKNNSIIKILGIIDEQGNIDVEVLHDELKKQVEKEEITIDVPAIGILKLNAADVDKLFYYIKNN